MERSQLEEPQDWLGADTDRAVTLEAADAEGLSRTGDDSLTPPLRSASADDGVPEPADAGSAPRVPSLDIPKPSSDQRRSNGARAETLSSAGGTAD